MQNSVSTKFYPRGVALTVSVFSFAAFMIFGSLVFMYYGFSTMVNPDLPEPQRSSVIAKNFFFNDGLFQVVFIVASVLATSIGLVSAVVHFIAALFRTPSRRTTVKLSVTGGVLGALFFVSYFVVSIM